MSKQEFLQRLREALDGEVPRGVIEENVRYYDEYIVSETRNGSSEDEVISSIGDPRLIAKTIMEASENKGSGSRQRTFYESFTDDGRTVYEEPDKQDHVHFIDLNKWYWKLLGVVVIILFFFLVAGIITGIFSLLMTFMGPILLIILVLWIVRGMKR